jgi:hypothetical protein
MLLWPRLDRAKLRRYADDPVRIAELVERRTSEPYDVILAMLTRQSDRLSAPTEASPGFESGNVEAARVAFRVVRSETETRAGERKELPA